MLITSKWDFYLTNIQPPFKTEDGTQELAINPRYIHEFFFIESLENLFLNAELVIDDKDGFFEASYLTGKEIIKVIVQQELNNPDMHMLKTFEFEIYEITIEAGTQENIHRFYLIEKGASEFYGTNFSVGFNNVKISAIMKSVMENQLKTKPSDYIIEETKDVLENYVIPYVKPTETIKSLVRKARRSTTGEGGYLFYSTSGDENRKTPMRMFVSLSSLIKKNLSGYYDKYTYRNPVTNPYFINNFKEVQNSSYCKQSIKSNGIGGKHYFGINYNVDKNVIDVSQTYSEFIKKTVLMGNTAFFDKSLDNKNDEMGWFGGEKETLIARQDYSMNMLLAGYNKREVILEGSLNRYAGKMIFVDQMSLNKSDVHNIQDYGYWLIKNITHYYAFGIYTQKVILIKDSLQESTLTKDKLLA